MHGQRSRQRSAIDIKDAAEKANIGLSVQRAPALDPMREGDRTKLRESDSMGIPCRSWYDLLFANVPLAPVFL